MPLPTEKLTAISSQATIKKGSVKMVQQDLSNGEPASFKDRYTPFPILFSEFKYNSSASLLEQLDREGPALLTVEGVPTFVVLTVADYEAFKPLVPDKTPRLRRIEGILYREVGKRGANGPYQ